MPAPSLVTDTPTSVGETFKHYQIRAALGEGGFGHVFEAWDTKLCRSVALKRLKHAAAPAAAGLADEARLAASVQHDAFVKIYAIEDDETSQSIVMELVRGKTLKQILAAGPVTADAARDVVVQIAQAMRDAHSLGLIHGDLKPSNVMQDVCGKVRILDFGMASRVDVDATSSLAQSDPQGTLAYMAPEMLTGTACSVRTDVYALGVVLYELVTGARPFAALQGLPLAAALVQSSSLQWSWTDDIAPSLRESILAMTARNPNQRLPDMMAVLASLAAPSLGQAVAKSHAQPAPGRRPWRWKRAIFALPLAALLIFVWQWRGDGLRVPPALDSFSASSEIARGLDALRLYDRPGKLAEAGEHFERVLAREPNNAAAVAGMSILYSRRHQSDGQDEVWLRKALAGAQQAVTLNDQLALAHAAHCIALERDGKSEAALDAAGRALALDPTDVFAMLGKVKAEIRLRRYDQARSLAERGLARYPRERSFADLIGQTHFEQGNYTAAERAFRLSLRLQPDAVFAYANLNATLHRQGRTEEALQILQQGLQVRPNAWLYGNLGTALFAGGDYTGAAAAFENAVSPEKGNPGNYLGWANLADTLLWIPGRQDQAKAAYAKARHLLAPRLQSAPNDVLLVSRMGLYMARTGERNSAQQFVERALRLAPNSMDVRFRAGMAFELTGNRERALDEILLARRLGYPDKAIDSEPDLVDLRRDPRYPQQ